MIANYAIRTSFSCDSTTLMLWASIVLGKKEILPLYTFNNLGNMARMIQSSFRTAYAVHASLDVYFRTSVQQDTAFGTNCSDPRWRRFYHRPIKNYRKNARKSHCFLPFLFKGSLATKEWCRLQPSILKSLLSWLLTLAVAAIFSRTIRVVFLQKATM